MKLQQFQYSVPVLETERTILRPHRLEDFEACVSLWSNPDVTRYITPRPFTKSEIWGRLLRYVAHWQLMGFGFWIVECKSRKVFLGEVGLFEHFRDVEPAGTGEPEAGWAFVPEAQGQGYATETMAAALSWAGDHLSEKRALCYIDKGNETSLRVAEKLGFTDRSEVLLKGEPAWRCITNLSPAAAAVTDL